MTDLGMLPVLISVLCQSTDRWATGRTFSFAVPPGWVLVENRGNSIHLATQEGVRLRHGGNLIGGAWMSVVKEQPGIDSESAFERKYLPGFQGVKRRTKDNVIEYVSEDITAGQVSVQRLIFWEAEAFSVSLAYRLGSRRSREFEEAARAVHLSLRGREASYLDTSSGSAPATASNRPATYAFAVPKGWEVTDRDSMMVRLAHRATASEVYVYKRPANAAGVREWRQLWDLDRESVVKVRKWGGRAGTEFRRNELLGPLEQTLQIVSFLFEVTNGQVFMVSGQAEGTVSSRMLDEAMGEILSSFEVRE